MTGSGEIQVSMRYVLGESTFIAMLRLSYDLPYESQIVWGLNKDQLPGQQCSLTGQCHV